MDSGSKVWIQLQLADILSINSGRDYKHLNQGDIPVYGTGGYMTSVDEQLSGENAIGLGRKGTINKPQLLSPPFWTVDTLFYLIPFEKYDLTFIYYLFQTINWLKYDESTGVPSLSKKTIEKIKVLLPSLEEQIAIGNKLKEIDTIITLEQEKLKNIEIIMDVTLKNLLVDIKTPEPKFRFNNFFGHWKIYSLGNISNIATGNMNTQDAINNGKYPFYIRSQDIMSIDNYSYDEEAILIPGEGKLGEIYHYVNGKYALHQRVYRISNFKANVSGQFIYWNMVAFFKRHIMRNTSSSTAPSIRKPALESYKLKMPNSIEEQEKIVSTLIDVNGILERQKNHIKSLNNLKDLLLQNLFV